MSDSRIVQISYRGSILTVYLRKRGPKNSRVEYEGESFLVPNSDILPSSGSPVAIKTPPPKAEPAKSLRPEEDWVIIQLSELGELELSHNVHQNEVFRHIGPCDIFFPWVQPRDGYDNPTVFTNNYLFIKHNYERPYGLLSKSNLFEGPLVRGGSTGSGKKPQNWVTLKSSEIQKMRDSLLGKMRQKFAPGDFVRVTDGPYQNLDGVVKSTSNSSVCVEFSLRSRVVTAQLEARVLEIL